MKVIVICETDRNDWMELFLCDKRRPLEKVSFELGVVALAFNPSHW